MTTTRPSVLDVALELNAAGFSTVPIRADGSKAPAVKWTERQHQLPTEAEVRADHDDPARGLGIVSGVVSGYCELLEFEGRVMHRLRDVAAALHDAELGDVWARVVTGWSESSPSGGMHLRYRIADGDVAPNYRIAQRPATPDELGEHVAQERDRIGRAGWDEDKIRRALQHLETLTVHDVPKVLAETRGEGGYAVAWPSNGTCHPSGGSWDWMAGGPDTIATITGAERAGLHRVVHDVLDETAPREPGPPRGGPPPTASGETVGNRPGDDFNARTSWAEVLEPYGWQAGELTPGGQLWTRPGKQPAEGHSAIVNAQTDRLKVFSTSVAELSAEEGTYDQWAVYAHYEHGGDFRAAASALRAAGYGSSDDGLLAEFSGADSQAAQLDTDTNQEDEHPDDAREPVALAAAEAVFRRWLGSTFDLDALRATLAVVAVERMDGDPVWLLVLSGSGNAKTEVVSAATGAGAHVVSTLSGEAALLSGTQLRDRSKNATGGLLRAMGARGVLVLKDVTSILSMHREKRAEVLAALREVADGRWVRPVGASGGEELAWEGRIAVIGAVTSAWDEHYSVIAQMGDRFAILRVDSGEAAQRIDAGLSALDGLGGETTMRAELAAAFGGVIAGAATSTPPNLSRDEQMKILSAADLVTRARTHVSTDMRGDPVSASAPESPTRFAKQVAQIVRGAISIGMERTKALRLGLRVARDSMPPQRIAVLEAMARTGGPMSTVELSRQLNLPQTTVRRECEKAQMLRLVYLVADPNDRHDPLGFTPREAKVYELLPSIDPTVLLASAPDAGNSP
ncbi:bifunctional DNA primase/polymerase [Isoptericola sp. NPDC057191]|uniref:bifunctional DNA primase/polymerase n=1 Tax=Isoptericola sp. NPDC057191 TaxID=3346041 RepID=UPI003638D962